MNIPITYTDGGRAERDERLDCAVRALAIAMDIPYYQSHKIFEHSGRKPRCRSYRTGVAIENAGLKIEQPAMQSLSTWLKFHPTGNFVVHKRGHMFAVKNGTVYDDTPISGRVRVSWYAEVK